MTGGDPRFDRYDWAGGREAMLRFGPDEGPVVVAALPLFEEANRTRAFMVAILRALAVRGIGSVLPDLPGQGESLVALAAVSLADLRDGFAAAVRRASEGGRLAYAAAVRSGALLDTHAPTAGRWHLAPQTGATLIRELNRIGCKPSASATVEIAGNLVASSLLDALRDAEPHAARVVRLSSDTAPADRTIAGPPLWRRTEPGNDPAVAQALADDIADWVLSCEG